MQLARIAGSRGRVFALESADAVMAVSYRLACRCEEMDCTTLSVSGLTRVLSRWNTPRETTEPRPSALPVSAYRCLLRPR